MQIIRLKWDDWGPLGVELTNWNNSIELDKNDQVKGESRFEWSRTLNNGDKTHRKAQRKNSLAHQWNRINQLKSVTSNDDVIIAMATLLSIN